MNAEKLDEEVRQEIQPELLPMPGVEFENVVVAAEAGDVTLAGHVSDISVRQAAEQLARRVPGVRSVANEIQIRRPRTDAELDVSLVRAVVEAFSRRGQGLD